MSLMFHFSLVLMLINEESNYYYVVLSKFFHLYALMSKKGRLEGCRGRALPSQNTKRA
jgi:hypothetical protein